MRPISIGRGVPARVLACEKRELIGLWWTSGDRGGRFNCRSVFLQGGKAALARFDFPPASRELGHEMRLGAAVALAMGLALASIGSRAFADPMVSRVAGREAKCAADSFSRVQVMSDSPACRRGGKNGKISVGAPRLQLPQIWEMTAASAWEAFPAPGLSAAVSGTHAFANAGTGPAVLNAKLDGKSGAPQAGQSEPPPN
jgi:hypothetical protein